MPSTRSKKDKKIMSKKSSRHRRMREQYGVPKCGKGEIIREGYDRKAYSKKSGSKVSAASVPPTCIQSRTGKPHGKLLFVLEKGALSNYGYEHVHNLSKDERRKALKRALKYIQPLSLMRRVNALYVLNKDQNPSLAKIFHGDAKWIKTTEAYQNRPTAKKMSKLK